MKSSSKQGWTPLAAALALALGGVHGHAWAAAMADEAGAVQMPAISVFGDAISAGTAGRSYISSADIERQQADNVASLLDTLPGVDLAGTPLPAARASTSGALTRCRT
ncbi:MAG: hypothetical protein RSH52_21755 [Janthinobacterium sp.]